MHGSTCRPATPWTSYKGSNCSRVDGRWVMFAEVIVGYGPAPAGAGIQVLPVKRSRRTSRAAWLFLRAVER